MLIYEVKPAIADGVIRIALETGLIAADWGSGLSVGRKLPAVHTRRMVTIRNDGGPAGRQSQRRYGINVWADDSYECEQIAGECSLILRKLPGTGMVTATDNFVDPVEIDDDPPFTIGGKDLFHFYFPFRATLRGA